MVVPLSIRVAADTPPLSFSLSASFGTRILPSPIIDRLGQWFSSFTRLLLRSLSLQPGYSLTALRRLCRWASEGNVSVTPCHPSYMAPAFTMSELSPVRKQYPLLGTPIEKIEPHILKVCQVLNPCYEM